MNLHGNGADKSQKKEFDEELRKKIIDDDFIKQQTSLLKPGIENSEARFRVHQFTCSAMSLPDFHEYDRFKPLIASLVDELNINDFLSCATALELMAEIATANSRNIDYFEQIGLLGKVYDLFNITKENPDLGILHTACIRFFGYLSTADPNSLSKFPQFVADLFYAIDNFNIFDPTRRILTFDTLAVISSTSGAKKFLTNNDCPYDMARAMKNFGTAVSTYTGVPDLKVRYIDALRIMFQSFNPKQPGESGTVLRSWFRQLGDHFSRNLFQCIKLPFPELQEASLRLLLALLRHQWAPNYFCTIDGFVDFLVNRRPDFSAEGCLLKYQVICALADSKSPAVDENAKQKFKDYKAKGPYAPTEEFEVSWEKAN